MNRARNVGNTAFWSNPGLFDDRASFSREIDVLASAEQIPTVTLGRSGMWSRRELHNSEPCRSAADRTHQPRYIHTAVAVGTSFGVLCCGGIGSVTLCRLGAEAVQAGKRRGGLSS